MPPLLKRPVTLVPVSAAGAAGAPAPAVSRAAFTAPAAAAPASLAAPTSAGGALYFAATFGKDPHKMKKHKTCVHRGQGRPPAPPSGSNLPLLPAAMTTACWKSCPECGRRSTT